MMHRMRRPRRWTLNGLTVLSVLLCLATVGLWVRSNRAWEWVAHQRATGRMFIISSRLGALDVNVTDGWPAGVVRAFERHSDPIFSAPPMPSAPGPLGFAIDRSTQNIG